MESWKKIGATWCLWPEKPIALIEMIGGTYLSATPQISYKKLLESLSKRNIAIHTWSYIPGLDHQTQANQAWKEFRKCRFILEEKSNSKQLPIRVGHSLGCKLHLLAPDGGRNSKSLITLAFNNFSINRSVPMVKNLQSKFSFKTEFSPSPNETFNLILNHYIQPKNYIINFQNDDLDQSNILLKYLKKRKNDLSQLIFVPGNHLTPASAGLRENLLGEWAYDSFKLMCLNELSEIICSICADKLRP